VTGVRAAAPAHDGQGRQAGGEPPVPKNNGLYPTVRGYDEATGIGTIKMAPFIIGSF
jgi:hypothetical protein